MSTPTMSSLMPNQIAKLSKKDLTKQLLNLQNLFNEKEKEHGAFNGFPSHH